jgi:hypothetical protein
MAPDGTLSPGAVGYALVVRWRGKLKVKLSEIVPTLTPAVTNTLLEAEDKEAGEGTPPYASLYIFTAVPAGVAKATAVSEVHSVRSPVVAAAAPNLPPGDACEEPSAAPDKCTATDPVLGALATFQIFTVTGT